MNASSKCLADGELEALDVIAMALEGFALEPQRIREAELEEAERREPLHAEAGGGAQLVEREAVAHPVAHLVPEIRVAEEEGLAEIQEQAHARGRGVLAG